MKVSIGNYVIEGEWGNYTVGRVKVVSQQVGAKNAGKEYITDQRFYGSLYQALFSLLNAKLGDADEVTVRALTAQINMIGKELKELADEIEQQQKEER